MPNFWDNDEPVAIADNEPEAFWQNDEPVAQPDAFWQNDEPVEPLAGQSPLETGARAAAMAPGTFAAGTVEGIGTAIQDVSDAADLALPGIGTLLPRLIPGAQFLKDAAPIAADISEEAQRVYAPDAQRNPIANTIGSGVGQAVGMLPLALTGGTPLVLGAAAASGYGEGSQTATELGIENPLGRIALGGTYAGVETAVERLGGIGAGPVKAAGREIVESLGKSTLKTIGSETLEEPVTGALQDAATLAAAQPVLDPTQPGQTVTGYRTAPLSPTSPEYWQKRGLEAIGGAAGGTVFAGLGALGRLSQPPTAGQPGTPPPLPPPTPTATVDIDGTPYTYNPAALTPEQITSLRATGSLQDYIDSGILTNATLPPPLPAAAPAPETGGVADPAPVGPPPLPVAAPAPAGPTVQEAQETLGDLGNVGSSFAGASLAGRPGPPPLARDLNGDLDLLNYLNENPIRAPRKGQEGSASGEYDWRESADFDPAYRRHIMQEGEPNIDQRAQEAFDLGFISAPTADALAAKVNEVIGKRRQQRQDRRAQTRQIDDLEAAALNFDRLQARLAQTGGRPIDPATLQPGRTLTIEGEPVIVSAIDYDQDGMPARLTLNTPAGQVFLGTESPLFEDADTAPDSLSDEELNAQLELAANPDGFTNTTVGTREDGSTIVFAELVNLASQAVQTGTRFAQWAADMVRQFGQGIKRYLAGAWQAARKTSQRGALDISLADNPVPDDSPAGLFEYDYRDESTLTAPEQRALTLLRKEYGASNIRPVWPTRPGRLRDLRPRQAEARDRGIQSLSEALKRLWSKEILFVEAPTSLNGTSSSDARNTLVVNLHSEEPILWIAGHELSHSLKAQAPELYADLETVVLANLQNREVYDERLRRMGYKDAQLNDEIVADFMGSQFMEPDFLNRLAIEKPSLFAKLANAIKKFINALLGRAAKLDRDVRPYLKGLEQLRDALANALRQYSERGQFPENPMPHLKGTLNKAVTDSRLSARPPTMAEAMQGQVRDSQFGERVQADPRLTPGVTAAAPTQFAVQGQQQALDAALGLIRDLGLDGATARFTADATLPMPVRIAGLMQAALQYDARAALLHRQGNASMSASADAATAAAIEAKANLEFIGNETGRNLAMFTAWNRMSPDGQLRRVDRQLEQGARDTIRGDIGTTVEEIDEQVQQATNDLTDDIIEQILLDGAPPQPVNLQTGAPIAERSFLDVFLGGVQQAAQAIADSTTLQSALRAVDTALKALSGKLFADPLLLTPAAQAILKTTRALLLQGTKLSQAIADAVADVRTKINIPPADVPPLTNAVTEAIIKEIVRPVLRKLAFDPAYNKREAVKDMLAMGIGVMPATRLADAVIAARPRIIKTAQAKIRERVMKRLSDKPRKRKREQKLPAILDTLIIGVANGFIANNPKRAKTTFLEAWDKKFKLPKLEPADRQRLLDLAREANLLPEGILRQAKAIEFQNAVALIEGIPTADAITAAWYANILSGPSTQAVNVVGNGFHMMMQAAVKGIVSPKELGKFLQGMRKGFVPGMREAREVLRTGKMLKVGKMDDMQKASALELMAYQGGPKTAGQFVSYIMSIGGFTRYAFRLMGAIDSIFWHSAQEGQAHLAIARSLRREEGLKPGTPAFNAEFIRQLGGDETQFLADLDQARTELLAAGVTPAQGAVNRRAWEIRHQRRSRRVQESSARFADRLTFQQKPEGIGQWIEQGITWLQSLAPFGVPVLTPSVPFKTIVANILESSLDWTGVGIMRGILGHHLTDFKNKDRVMFDNQERKERFMAGVIGATIIGGVIALAQAFINMDDDEVPFMPYAGGPPDPTRRGLMPKGWRPYTLKIGDTYYSYAETPLGPLLSFAGGFMDAVRYGNHTNKSLTDRGMLALLGAMDGFARQGVLSSLKGIADKFTGDGGVRGLKQMLLSPAAGFIPGQGALRDVASLFDRRKISDADVTGALIKDIPVLKSYGRPALNVLGEEIEHEGSFVARRFLTPKRPDANLSFIHRHGLKIPALDRTIEIGAFLDKRARMNINREENDKRIALGMTALENGVMTPAQQYQFTKAQGTAIKAKLEQLRIDYANEPKDERTTQRLQKRLDDGIQVARRNAMRDIVTDLK